MSYKDDPYWNCANWCNHILAEGVLVTDLLASDGPHPPLAMYGLVMLPLADTTDLTDGV